MLQLIKQVLADIKLLYKNFIHWNLSKAIYYIYGILLAIVLAIPTLIVFLLFIWVSPLELSLVLSFFAWDIQALEFGAGLLANPISAVLSFLILLLTVTTAYIGIAYGEYLLYGLNFEYIKDKKTNYLSKKRFLNYKLLIKYYYKLKNSFTLKK